AISLDRSELRGELAFRDVSFAYDDDRTTLSHVSFAAAPGTRIAVVGETGRAKTTLGYLAARPHDATDGRGDAAGRGLPALSFATLRLAIGVVSQETYLFHGSVRENLRFARPDATDEELEQAARAAQIHDHLASLPDGYDTIVGERGYRFSGGEKQRLALARAILRDPCVLILDEATSALDVETERQVREAPQELRPDRTPLAIPPPP